MSIWPHSCRLPAPLAGGSSQISGILASILAVMVIALPLTMASAQLKPNTEGPEVGSPEQQSVLVKPRPDYDALGSRVGGFLLFPSLKIAEGYDSNVYVTPSDRTGDLVSTISPSVTVSSDWNNHFVSLKASTDIKRYADRVSENNTDSRIDMTGRLDILRNVTLAGSLDWDILHESRTSADSVASQKSPIEYQLLEGKFSLLRDPGRLSLRLDGSVDSYRYSNGVTNAGILIPESYRDRTDTVLVPRISYEIWPGYHAFVKFPLNDHVYQSTSAATGPNRNSAGYEIDAGTAVDLGHLITGETFVGILHQDYADPLIQPLSGLSFGANLLWNPSAISSVKLAVLHLVQETTLAGASADLQTAIMPSVEHELRENILLSAGLSYVMDDFQGARRVDHSYEGNASVRYLINRNISLDLNATYRKRLSDAALADFQENIVSGTIRLQN